MIKLFFLLILWDESLAYDSCPGDKNTYWATGISEQRPFNGTCVPVDKPCHAESHANVSCGGHSAASCSKCGPDGGSCHGDCEWNAGKCVPRVGEDECYTSVLCGGHSAASCSKCGPDGGWCHGDCEWDGGKCVDRDDAKHHSVFHLWSNHTCVRGSQWYTCDSSTGSTGALCTPGSPGCQPLHVPCGGKCPGGGRYKEWWKCPNPKEQKCLLSTLVCSGLGPFCADGADQTMQTCSNTQTECPPVSRRRGVSRSHKCEGERPYQCVKPVKGLDCLDASDVVVNEVNGQMEMSKNDSDNVIREFVKKLKSCTTNTGFEGLQCQNQCIEMSAWCNPTHWYVKVCKLQSDPPIEVSDVRHAGSVCTDKEAWEGRPCDNKYWQRCSGTHPGQCYIKTDQCVTTGGFDTCQDYSHLVCHIDGTYATESGVKSTGKEVCSREEMFQCGSGDTCVFNKLVCDGTPQCPDGSDDNSTTCQCPWKLEDYEGPDLLKNRKVSAATVQCIDNRFPGLNISTCAVKCDGTEECLGGEDEEGCQEDKIKFWSSVAAIVSFFVIASILVVHLLAPPIQRKIDEGKQDQQNEIELVEPLMNHESTTRMINLICNSDEARTTEEERKMLFASLHQDADFSDKLQIVGTTIQLHRSKTEVERRNQILLDLEYEHHEGSGHEICLKNNLGTSKVTEAVLKGKTPEMMDKLIQLLSTIICCCCEMEERVFRLSSYLSYNQTIQIMSALFEMAFYYVDLLKDLAVVYVLFTLTTTNDLEYGVFLVTFNGALLILMVWSIAASILLTSAFLTGSHPGVELQLLGVKRSGLLNLVRLLTFFLSLLVPTTLVYQLTRQRITLKDLELKLMRTISTNQGQVDPRDIQKLREQKERVNLLDYLTYFRQKNDLVLEIVIQASVNIVMILVVRSAAESLTETGLQAVFSDSTVLLAVGFTMSIKKIISANIKLVAADKNGFLPFTGMCLKAIGYLLTSLVRIGCVTLYFGLPLGILNILVHKNSLTKYNRDSRSLIYDVKDENGIVSVLRMNQTYTITLYTELTGMRLCWFGVIFFIGVIIHILLVTLSKTLLFSEAFSKLSKMEKFLHVLHTIAFPEASVDWDFGSEGTLEVYKKQWEAFKQENIFMVGLFTVENILMAVPVVTICSNVIRYHESLPYTNAIEKEAYETARLLRIVWPVVVLVTPILQGLLLFIYNKAGHPWKAIYAKFGDITSLENTDSPIDTQAENRRLQADLQMKDQRSEAIIEHMEEENGEDLEHNKNRYAKLGDITSLENTDSPIDTQAENRRLQADVQMKDQRSEAIIEQMEEENGKDLEHNKNRIVL